jgi:bifunctional enzyme CysN/CysC
MATAASVSDFALLLVDARNGITTQTRRHSWIAARFGIRHVALAINKCDLVGYSEAVFSDIADAYAKLANSLGIAGVQAIPVSALRGDNVSELSGRTPWYRGPSLLQHLESVEVERERAGGPFRLPVQWVCRPDSSFRGFAGTIESGRARPGDAVTVAASGAASRIARILIGEREVAEAAAGQAVMVSLTDEIDASRGDIFCEPKARPQVVDQFAAHILWLDQVPMVPGRQYIMKLASRSVPASITALKHRIDVNSGAQVADRTLGPNEIGFCNLATATPVAIDPFSEVAKTGSFILIDRASNATAGAGTIDFPLRRASNLHPQHVEIDKAARAALNRHRAAVVWLTGLSGAGKSTIANLVEKKLHVQGAHTYLIDGDNIRGGLNRDLGFTEADRVENVRRVTEVARLFADAGLIVIVSLISPFRAERDMARERIGTAEFVEVFVDTPIEECKQRDPKGLYAKAARGELVNFTGVDSPYEAPEAPDLRLSTPGHSADELADQVVAHLRRTGVLEHMPWTH